MAFTGITFTEGEVRRTNGFLLMAAAAIIPDNDLQHVIKQCTSDILTDGQSFFLPDGRQLVVHGTNVPADLDLLKSVYSRPDPETTVRVQQKYGTGLIELDFFHPADLEGRERFYQYYQAKLAEKQREKQRQQWFKRMEEYQGAVKEMPTLPYQAGKVALEPDYERVAMTHAIQFLAARDVNYDEYLTAKTCRCATHSFYDRVTDIISYLSGTKYILNNDDYYVPA